MAVNWRVWMKETLDAAGLTGIPPAQITAAGSLEATPPVAQRPFIVIRVGPKLRGPFPGVHVHNAAIWVHDEPGDYGRIDTALEEIRAAIEGSVPEADGVAARWLGDSQELADDLLGTILRNTTYQLNGKD